MSYPHALPCAENIMYFFGQVLFAASCRSCLPSLTYYRSGHHSVSLGPSTVPHSFLRVGSCLPCGPVQQSTDRLSPAPRSSGCVRRSMGGGGLSEGSEGFEVIMVDELMEALTTSEATKEGVWCTYTSLVRDSLIRLQHILFLLLLDISDHHPRLARYIPSAPPYCPPLPSSCSTKSFPAVSASAFGLFTSAPPPPATPCGTFLFKRTWASAVCPQARDSEAWRGRLGGEESSTKCDGWRDGGGDWCGGGEEEEDVRRRRGRELDHTTAAWGSTGGWRRSHVSSDTGGRRSWRNGERYGTDGGMDNQEIQAAHERIVQIFVDRLEATGQISFPPSGCVTPINNTNRRRYREGVDVAAGSLIIDRGFSRLDDAGEPPLASAYGARTVSALSRSWETSCGLDLQERAISLLTLSRLYVEGLTEWLVFAKTTPAKDSTIALSSAKVLSDILSSLLNTSSQLLLAYSDCNLLASKTSFDAREVVGSLSTLPSTTLNIGLELIRRCLPRPSVPTAVQPVAVASSPGPPSSGGFTAIGRQTKDQTAIPLCRRWGLGPFGECSQLHALDVEAEFQCRLFQTVGSTCLSRIYAAYGPKLNQLQSQQSPDREAIRHSPDVR
eukprot:GHVS01039788.1.p1 GENE.GHVS01039788.1~~GHVS01039788.1.p1  ORF type:complete len:622 (+),score=58.17 GHVS01039788.1:32-1867(+)